MEILKTYLINNIIQLKTNIYSSHESTPFAYIVAIEKIIKDSTNYIGKYYEYKNMLKSNNDSLDRAFHIYYLNKNKNYWNVNLNIVKKFFSITEKKDIDEIKEVFNMRNTYAHTGYSEIFATSLFDKIISSYIMELERI